MLSIPQPVSLGITLKEKRTLTPCLLLIGGVEHIAVLSDDLDVRRLVLEHQVGTRSDASGVSSPQRSAAAVHDQVSVGLEDEEEVASAAVARGRSDGAAVLVGDEVPVGLEDEADSAGELDDTVAGSTDAEVGEFSDIGCRRRQHLRDGYECDGRNLHIVSDCAIC